MRRANPPPRQATRQKFIRSEVKRPRGRNDHLRDAVVFSTWDWDVFNVPERVALALASRGARVLYCAMPVSRFHHSRAPLRDVARGVHRFVPEYLGSKFSSLPIVGNLQWEVVARQIISHAKALQLKDPVFLYSHVERMTALCKAMRAAGFPLIHICMDYPEAYQYELIELSDQTLVIPKAVFHDLRAKYGEKIQWIPQSIHLPASRQGKSYPAKSRPNSRAVPRPRLGYLGPIFARLNLPMLREFLTAESRTGISYISANRRICQLPNAHAMAWRPPEELPGFVASFDVGMMPYDCTDDEESSLLPVETI